MLKPSSLPLSLPPIITIRISPRHLQRWGRCPLLWLVDLDHGDLVRVLPTVLIRAPDVLVALPHG